MIESTWLLVITLFPEIKVEVTTENAKLESIYDPHHPAVLKLIRMTIENGHKGGARVGICGELAADTSLTQKFIEYGVDELSVSPSFILPVRNAVLCS